MKFIFLSLSFFLIAFATYSVAISRLPDHLKAGGRAGSQYEMNVMRAQEFFYSADTPSVVVCGTSVASRLEALPADWFNLAFSGDSAFTSLEILTRSGKTPAYVLIETNVLTRDLNLKLVEDVAQPLMRQARQSSPALLETNKPAHVALRAADPVSRNGFVIFPPGRLRPGQPLPGPIVENNAEPEIPPNMPAQMYADLVDGQIKNAAIPIGSERIDQILKQLADYITTLQARGVRVILFEVPEHPSVMSQPGFREMHDRLVTSFPASQFAWIPPIDPHLFHTTDGVHLTTPGTIRYCQILKEFIATDQTAKTNTTHTATTRP